MEVLWEWRPELNAGGRRENRKGQPVGTRGAEAHAWRVQENARHSDWTALVTWGEGWRVRSER